MVWIAAGVGAVLIISGVVALSDTTDRQGVGSANSTLGAPSTTVAPSVGGGVPVFWNGGELDTSDSVADEPLAMADSSVGEAPVWNTWALDVPAPLDTTTEPMGVVAFGADGILYRIAFPSGQLRAMRMSGWDDAGAQAVVGEGAIVVFSSTDVSIVRDDEPIVRVPIVGGQQLTLELDGTLAPIDSDSVDGSIVLERSFLPDGRVVVNRPGGVYAVGIDQLATRLSDGDLLATGAARISPDGRTIVFANPTTGTLRLLDVATGATLDIGSVSGPFPASWASDSSGVFSEASGSILFHPRDTGRRVTVDGIDRIVSVATRRVSSGE